MENRDFKHNKSYCVALGFFDCMHLGHQKIFSETNLYAKNRAISSAVFTFSDDTNKSAGKQLYTFCERKELYRKCGIETVIAYPFNDETKNKSGEEFLDELVLNYGAVAFFCGDDYRFGAGAKCGVEFIADYCKRKSLELIVVPTVVRDGEKVSSTRIKSLITNGQIKKANEMLSEPYFIIGEVIHGKGVGHLFGFPTANIKPSSDKFSLRSGVYGCKIEIGGKSYKAVANIGTKPTFSDFSTTIEAFIVDYDGNAYGEMAKLSVLKRLRDTKKFDSPQSLREQIYKDANFMD